MKKVAQYLYKHYPVRFIVGISQGRFEAAFEELSSIFSDFTRVDLALAWQLCLEFIYYDEEAPTTTYPFRGVEWCSAQRLYHTILSDLYSQLLEKFARLT